MDPIIATWLVKIVAREAEQPITDSADGETVAEPSAPTNDQLEAAIVSGLAKELGLTVTASAERTDK